MGAIDCMQKEVKPAVDAGRSLGYNQNSRLWNIPAYALALIMPHFVTLFSHYAGRPPSFPVHT